MNLEIDGRVVTITNPEKVLWPKLGIRKVDYLKILLELASYLLHYTRDHLLTVIRYPNGRQGKSFFQKNIPAHSPDWIQTHLWHDHRYIILSNIAVLAWLGNQAALELHIPFNTYDHEDYPTALVFDLDPSEGQDFQDVAEVALIILSELNSLNIASFVKTSGASGLQIYIPVGAKYDYAAARQLNRFFAQYFSQKYPQKITLERSVGKRSKKLYFDYLQMGQGKTIICPYSPRATEYASVAAPLEWCELKKGIHPCDINLLNISERLKAKGDIFAPLLTGENSQDLDFILKMIH